MLICSPKALSLRRPGAMIIDVATIWTEHYKRFGAPPPFDTILAATTGDLDLVFTAACLARRPGDSGKVSDVLNHLGIEVRERLVARDQYGQFGKSNCDAEVAFALGEAGADNPDVIVAMLGDIDYLDPLRRLRDRGCRLRIVGHRQSISTAIRHVAHEVRYIDDILHTTMASVLPIDMRHFYHGNA